jgi:amino acid transporter
MAIMVGIVVGAGIFKTPSLVAAGAGSEWAVMLFWLAGGLVSLIGALCYAELTSAYPSAGGDYFFLKRAFGLSPAFLFAWARVTVIQTGSVAMMAFVIGDYLSEIVALGTYSSSIYAVASVVLLTTLNCAGIRQGKWTQNLLTIAIVVGLGSVIAAGLFVSAPGPVQPRAENGNSGGIGLAMIFVLLTYGGWNEVAYVSAEVRQGRVRRRRSMVQALVWGTLVVTCIYLAANFAFLKGLGLQAMVGAEVVAADLMRRSMGDAGAHFISFLIALAALSTMNGTMITGARSSYALGKDHPFLGFLGKWRRHRSTPVNAYLVQGGIALGLIFLGTYARTGFRLMVEYTAPVFWFFFLLVGLSIFVLRRREPDVPRPFEVPLYPVTPILFCLVCIYMLYASLVHARTGALVGVAVLVAGFPLLWLARRTRFRSTEPLPSFI